MPRERPVETQAEVETSAEDLAYPRTTSQAVATKAPIPDPLKVVGPVVLTNRCTDHGFLELVDKLLVGTNPHSNPRSLVERVDASLDTCPIEPRVAPFLDMIEHERRSHFRFWVRPFHSAFPVA